MNTRGKNRVECDFSNSGNAVSKVNCKNIDVKSHDKRRGRASKVIDSRLRSNKSKRKTLKPNENTIEKKNIEVYDFECDSNEEPSKNAHKSKKPPQRKTVKKNVFNNYFNYGNRLQGIRATTRNKETISHPVEDKNKCNQPLMKKIVRNIGKIPIVQIVPIVEEPKKCEVHNPVIHSVVEELPVEDNFDFNVMSDDRLHSPILRSVVTPTSDGQLSPIPNFDFDVPADRSDKSNSTITLANNSDKSYDDFHPVICSSAVKRMQVDPTASPWRVEPVVEVSRRRHVYLQPTTTDKDHSAEVPLVNNATAEIVIQNNASNSSEDHSWKKDSILSHYRDVIKSKRQCSPSKTHKLGANVDDDSAQSGQNTIEKFVDSTCQSTISTDLYVDPILAHSSPVKIKSSTPLKKNSFAPEKMVDYFGFEDECEDQENISPNKQFVNCNRRKIPKRVAKRPCLRELNQIIPSDVQSEVVKSFDVADPAILPEINKPNDEEDEIMAETPATDPEIIAKQVALFEDPELPDTFVTIPKIAYNIRKGTKRNTQKKKTVVIADSDNSDNSDAEDYVAKAIFRHKKKKTNANVKEKHELDNWAASFNSMLNEVEGYDLCIE